MGQHLQLFASKEITKEEAQTWCECRAFDIIRCPTPEQQKIVDKVNSDKADRLSHWASGGGVACFGLLVWESHICDSELIQKAEIAGREYRQTQMRRDPDSTYAKHDWENDDAVRFLRDRIGFVIWGDNDGV